MMILGQIALFAVALTFVVKGATLATRYSARLAEGFSISRYVIGFVVVAFISILPETFIALNAAFQGVPEFGLGTLLGSNVADLTLIFALLVLLSGRNITIESKILKNVSLYPLFMLLPVILGLDGHFSRIDGAVLLLAGFIFYYSIFRHGSEQSKVFRRSDDRNKDLLMLLLSMVMLLLGAHFTVSAATSIASMLHITPILIGLLIVSLGTTMPEFLYSLKAVRQEEDSLAVGDILGTVLADATIVVGLLALINPFHFPLETIYITGIFMVAASLILLLCMRSGRNISTSEALILLILWGVYAGIEIILNT